MRKITSTKKTILSTIKRTTIFLLILSFLCSCSSQTPMSQTSSSRMSDIHESPEDYVASQEVDTEVLLQELVESLQTLHFSDEMTPESDLKVAQELSELLNHAESAYYNDGESVSLEGAIACNQLCFDALKTLEKEDKIDYVSYNLFDVFVRFKSGLNYIYQPKTEGLLSNSQNDKFQLIAIEPCYKEFKSFDYPLTFKGEYLDKYDPLLEAGFDDLSEPLFHEPIIYREKDEDENKDEDFSLKLLKNLPKYSIIHWIGHGTTVEIQKDSKNKTPVLITNSTVHEVKDLKDFASLYQDEGDKIWNQILNRIGITNYNKIFITPEFLRRMIPDHALEGSIVHIGACCSASNDELLKVFIDKGAAFATGYTDYAQNVYAKEIMGRFTEEMQKKNQGTSFPLLKDVVKEAKKLVVGDAKKYSPKKNKFVWTNDYCEFVRKNGKTARAEFVCLENSNFPDYSLGNLIEEKRRDEKIKAEIKEEESQGNIVISGTIRVLSGGELCDLQGIEGSYSDDNLYTVLVLDKTRNMDLVSLGGTKNSDVKIIGLQEFSSPQEYDGQKVCISFDPARLLYPSDASLPLGEPRTTVYKILQAE